MLERLAFGELPRKHHIALYDASGRLRYEECLTRRGFDGPFTIAYHSERPQALRATGEAWSEAAEPGGPLGDGTSVPPNELRRTHYRTLDLATTAPGVALEFPLLYNADLVLGVRRPRQSDATYRINASADELWFILDGAGTVRSLLGDLDFVAGDYVALPKGLLHRLIVEGQGPQHYLVLEFPGGVGIPARFRNPVGQIKMDAPYSHRDFKRPHFTGPNDEGLREVWVKTGRHRHKFAYPHNPLDVVGWDGTLYPWAFPILNFQPRVSSVHLPPTWHGTFEARGALICSFVPRPLDFHPEAVPCPYTHTSADVDEVLFYVAGDFASRLGVGRGSLTHHPGGIPHGPHPGRYEASPGAQRTDEVAVMLDCSSRLWPTAMARAVESGDYEASFDDTLGLPSK
jgi:homogentisate 1,2-dioxygenase